MGYNFRDDNPILGPNAAIEMLNGAGASTLVGVPLITQATFFSAAAPSAGSTIMFQTPLGVSNALGNPALGSYIFLGASVFYSTASSSGTIRFFHDTGTQAAGAGTAVSASTSLSTAASSGVYIPVSSGLSNANLVYSATDRLSFTLGGTLTGLVNLYVTAYMARVAIQPGGSISF